ncbi:hypothetical protein BGW36DRAFT_381246 [Talaromyces proteolyticus]|uniref:Uncharacterized protein n=1 Tax=Talaromyces proteolyticus TaxID=1131652 RepID=A0AAD4KPW9_9EURO|nr:uncharacterized protein BGW36DRAFT_381246 [Talaromyces proteolyticus]KAH8696565.1 hypothetical protein BGW36DRAFT_381246 [Talaromyces proteolyticus]
MIQPAGGRVDKLNFKAWRLVWAFDPERLVALARQCFRLGMCYDRHKYESVVPLN